MPQKPQNSLSLKPPTSLSYTHLAPALLNDHLVTPKIALASTPTNTGAPSPTAHKTNNLPCLSLFLTTSLYRSFPKLTREYCVFQPRRGNHTLRFSSAYFRTLYNGLVTDARISV